jgi:hypothetical protein
MVGWVIIQLQAIHQAQCVRYSMIAEAAHAREIACDSGAYVREIAEAAHTYNTVAYHGGMIEY